MTSPQPNPIYIIGDDALACYLAAHFQDIDENPIILSSPSNTKDLSTNGVTIKEEFTTLRKKHYRFSTASIMTTDAKAVIILPRQNQQRSLALLQPSQRQRLYSRHFRHSGLQSSFHRLAQQTRSANQPQGAPTHNQYLLHHQQLHPTKALCPVQLRRI